MFHVDPDIRIAETLSSEFYLEDSHFEAAKRKLFARTWQFAALKDDVDNVKPVNLLEGVLDEPVLFTRDGEEMRCVSNVCTHRGMLLVEESCKVTGLRCAYHGKRFALDGKFLSMPEFEEALNFPSEKDDLPKVPSGSWEQMLFASVDPVAPLDDFFEDVRKRTAGMDLSKLELVGGKDYTVDAHWAIYCENFLEGFHVPYVHPALMKTLDYESYTTELSRYSSVQTAWETTPTEERLLSVARAEVDPFDAGVAAMYFLVFPNIMLNFYPWGLSVNIVKPVSKTRTTVSYMTFVGDESKRGQGAGGDLDTVELEDQAVVRAVQTGIRSSFYDRGRYSPTREQGTHHFHRLICEFLKG
jgi:choline monooxygenase